MVVRAGVGAPDGILVAALHLPGDIKTTCRLLRADRCPTAELSSARRSAAIFQLRASSSADAVEIEITADLHQAGRAGGLDHRRRHSSQANDAEVVVDRVV